VWVRNYSVQEYDASCQNWDLTICSRANLYVANNSGLLTFDGNSWRTHLVPDDRIITEVVCWQDTVYTRGPSVQGYWVNDGFGLLKFHPVDNWPLESLSSTNIHESEIPLEIQKARPSAFASLGIYKLIGTEINGVYILNEKNEIVIHLSRQNQLQDNIVRAICVQDDSQFWIALDNGLSQVCLDPPLALMGERSAFGKLLATGLYGDVLYIQTNIGFYKKNIYSGLPFSIVSAEEASGYLQYNEPEKLFSAEDSVRLSVKLGEFSNPDHIYPVPDNLYWVTKENEAGLFHFGDDSETLKCRILFDNYNMNLVNRDRQFFPLNDSLCIVSTMQGIVLVNSRKLIGGNLGMMVIPVFKGFEYTNADGIDVLIPDKNKISLPFNFSRASVYISTSLFTPNHQISYKIEGVSSEWSEWQRDGQISFLQLPAGKYMMHIRKYSVKGPFPETTFQIEVRPPWYRTLWAYMGYLLIILLGGWVSVQLYINHLRGKEEKRRESLRLIEEQQKQLEENRLLEEELQAKKNELSLQTTALVRRNETIQDVLEELDKQKEALGDRYPNKLYLRMQTLLEKTKGDQDDWILFESYFNSAHRDFTDRLRQTYTDITPGDLRVCCLLRMNLSTKEIASLLNISIRAVELRRYRLRKRLGLDGDTNLIDFLVNF